MKNQNRRLLIFLIFLLLASGAGLYWRYHRQLKHIPDTMIEFVSGGAQGNSKIIDDTTRMSNITLPFLGDLQTLSFKLAVNGDRVLPFEQEWTIQCSQTGEFLAADYSDGIVQDLISAQLLEESYRSLGETIVSTVKTKPKIRFDEIRKVVMNEVLLAGPEGKINRIRIRRVLLKREGHGDGDFSSEVYTATIWGKHVLESARPGFGFDVMRVVFDQNGNTLYLDAVE